MLVLDGKSEVFPGFKLVPIIVFLRTKIAPGRAELRLF